MAQNKHIHYGKLVRKQVTLLSLELFPSFLRLARDHQLSQASQRILDYLRIHGKTSTTNLRKNLGFMKKEQKPEFVRAIDELQITFAITIVEREKAPRYTYTYDLMERWMPKSLIKKAEAITPEAAKETIIGKMLATKVIVSPLQAKRFVKL